MSRKPRGFQSDAHRKAVMAALRKQYGEIKLRRHVDPRRKDTFELVFPGAKKYRRLKGRTNKDKGLVSPRTFRTAEDNLKERNVIGSITLEGLSRKSRKHSPNQRGKHLLRTHSRLHSDFRGDRLGAALYILGLREAKKRGFGGLYSYHNDRSDAAAKLWDNIKTRRIPGRKERTGMRGKSGTFLTSDLARNFEEGNGFDTLTSVRPHARRRGKKKRAKKKG